jgi:hypothetical protein
MNRTSPLFAGVASAVLCLAGWALGAGTAQADPYGHVGGNCPSGMTCGRWCPGESTRGLEGVNWDWNACHNFAMMSQGIVDVDTGAVVYAWPGGPIRQATPPSPSPALPADCPPWSPILAPSRCGGL